MNGLSVKLKRQTKYTTLSCIQKGFIWILSLCRSGYVCLRLNTSTLCVRLFLGISLFRVLLASGRGVQTICCDCCLSTFSALPDIQCMNICICVHIYTHIHTLTFLPVSESNIKWPPPPLPPYLCGRLGRLTFGHLSIISFNSQAVGKMESGGQQLRVSPWQQLHWSSCACWACSSKCVRVYVCVWECPFLFLFLVCARAGLCVQLFPISQRQILLPF